MILKENLSQLVHSTGNDLQTEDYGIDARNMGMAIRAFYQYSDVISSIVREITSNCFDAHKEAKLIPGLDDLALKNLGYSGDLKQLRNYFKNWKDRLVRVTIREGNFLSGETKQIEFEDWGVGMSPGRMKTIFTKFFSSTKRDTNEFIGAYGLGSKSPLGYCDLFLITTIFFGIKYSYAVLAGDVAPQLKLLSEEPTDEINGTVFSIPIKDERDLILFRSAIKRQLMYFDGLIIEGVPNYNSSTILRGENFIFRENNSSVISRLHLCLGKVFYPLESSHFSELNYNNLLLPVGLYFPVGALDVVWNRENIEYTAETIDVIKEKINLLRVEFQTLWDKNFSNIDTIDKLIAAADQSSKNKFLIDDTFIPHTKEWITPDIFFSPKPELGRFTNARFVEAALNFDRKVTNGKTKRISKYDSLDPINQECFLWYPDCQKSNPLINQYIYQELDIDQFNLVSWKDPETAAKFMLTFSIKKKLDNYTYPEWSNYSDNDREAWIEFMRQIMVYLGNKLGTYSRSIIPDSWIEEKKLAKKATAKELREIRKARIDSNEKLDPILEDMSYRMVQYWDSYIDSNACWRRRTIDYKIMNTELGTWLKNSMPIIYGTNEEREELVNLYIFLNGRRSLYYDFESSKTPYWNGKPMFILVSKQNCKTIASFPTTFSLSEYKPKLKKFLCKVKTAHEIKDSVSSLVSAKDRMLGDIPNYSKLYSKLHKYVNQYNPHAKNDYYINLPKQEIPWDLDIISELKKAVAIVKRYPMLAHVLKNEFKTYSEDVQKEFSKYLFDKGQVTPDLYMRLATYKKKKSTQSLKQN